MCVCSGLQGERRLVHHDVPLGGCGPQGLPGGRSSDPSKLTAAVGQQGQLETQDNIISRGNRGNIAGKQTNKQTKNGQDLPSTICARRVSFESLFCQLLPSRSCPARRALPGSGATSAWSVLACTRRRRSVPLEAAEPAPSLRLETPEDTERNQKHFSVISVGQ